MHYKYISSSLGQKSTCSSYENSPNNVKWTRCKYPKWEVVPGAPDRVNIPCPVHDTSLCQLGVEMTTSTEPNRYKYKTCQKKNNRCT